MRLLKRNGKLATTLAVCIVIVVGTGALIVPALQGSNCGRNSAALTACRHVAICIQQIDEERKNGPFAIEELSESERGRFTDISGLDWLRNAKVLVACEIHLATQRSKEIIAVCNRPYDNVPQRIFGKSPLTHAVAYADGSTGLISIEEFRRLDLSKFVDVTTIPE
jgi:hypothetical protein